MGNLFHDLRYGFRTMVKNPGFAAVAVISLALGIGANSTVFSIVDGLFLRPWPVKDPDRLVVVSTDRPKEPDFRMSSYPDYLDIRQRSQRLLRRGSLRQSWRLRQRPRVRARNWPWKWSRRTTSRRWK